MWGAFGVLDTIFTAPGLCVWCCSFTILRALEGSDKLNGGPGQDTLEGGPDADTFILSDLDAVDLIADYNFDDGDVIDVTALVSAHLNGSGSDPNTVLGEYVQLVEQGDGAVDQLQVDVNGGADSFTTVATLNGDAGVKVVFDDNVVGTSGEVVI